MAICLDFHKNDIHLLIKHFLTTNQELLLVLEPLFESRLTFSSGDKHSYVNVQITWSKFYTGQEETMDSAWEEMSGRLYTENNAWAGLWNMKCIWLFTSNKRRAILAEVSTSEMVAAPGRMVEKLSSWRAREGPGKKSKGGLGGRSEVPRTETTDQTQALWGKPCITLRISTGVYKMVWIQYKELSRNFKLGDVIFSAVSWHHVWKYAG